MKEMMKKNYLKPAMEVMSFRMETLMEATSSAAKGGNSFDEDFSSQDEKKSSEGLWSEE